MNSFVEITCFVQNIQPQVSNVFSYLWVLTTYTQEYVRERKVCGPDNILGKELKKYQQKDFIILRKKV